MNNELMIEKLKKVGIKFDKGLTNEEIIRIETLCSFKFPEEIKSFLSAALPVGNNFYNYRNINENNISLINDFQKEIEDSFIFDIEQNHLLEEFRDKFKDCKNDNELKDKIFNYLHESPKLIPFYAHRCFFSGLNNMPIISFWQPTDSIFYGSDFENYLINEFIDKQCNVGEISKDFEKTGIWFDLIW